MGSLNARRTEVRPFTPAQIKLLETFADQAVIAIENVRLFQELKESLEQQTATSEILGVIASSPTDISRCWIRSPRAPRGCATPTTRSFACRWRHSSLAVALTDQCQSSPRRTIHRPWMRSAGRGDARAAERSISMTLLSEREAEFPDARTHAQQLVIGPVLGHAVAARRHVPSA